MAGLGNVAKTGAQSAGRAAASRASASGQRMAAPFRAGWNGQAADAGAAGGAGASSQAAAGEAASGAANAQPAWAKRLHRRPPPTHAATTTAPAQIRRAPCSASVCQYVELPVVAVSLTKK